MGTSAKSNAGPAAGVPTETGDALAREPDASASELDARDRKSAAPAGQPPGPSRQPPAASARGNASAAAGAGTNPAPDTNTVTNTAAAANTAPEKTPAGRHDEAQLIVLGILLSGMLGLLGWRYAQLVRSRPGALVIEQAASGTGYRIDVNAATWVELSQLEGVGPVLAKRIVADRRENGPFESVADLQRVPGVGPRTVDRNRRWLTVSSDAAP